MIWLETEYLGKADETIQTVIVGEDVVYVHFYNGYYSLIAGVNNLVAYLSGENYTRFFCTDSEEKLIEEIEKLERS